MIAFIIDKRKFKGFEKKPELVFIFNDEKLFETLRKDFKCVNLNKRGLITKENFFPKTSLKSISRLFLEQVHKNDVKNFVKDNIYYYKTLQWY